MSRQSFHRVEDELLVLDEEQRLVYRVPAELTPEAEAVLSEPASSTSRRRFLQALAAGSIAGVAIIALPSAAAASSHGDGGSSGDGGDDDDDDDAAPQFFSLSTTPGNESVAVTVA
jgi:hypothetical protein